MAAIVVTYNRKQLLCSCLDALLAQTFPLGEIHVVDNASTDGTRTFLESKGYLDRGNVHYLPLRENAGGAGGFYAGLKAALEGGCDWYWLMDDDAEPESDAAAALVELGLDVETAYGSCAVARSQTGILELCWPVDVLRGERSERIVTYDGLPRTADVRSLPFLGFVVSRMLVERVGLPDARYFLSGDDVDYSHRIRGSGGNLVCVKDSRITHPRPDRYVVNFFGRPFDCLRLAPWKRYYDIRNRVINGRRHYGWRLASATLPGILLRWAATVIVEPAPVRQSAAYGRGLLDGILGRLGKRWEPGG